MVCHRDRAIGQLHLGIRGTTIPGDGLVRLAQPAPFRRADPCKARSDRQAQRSGEQDQTKIGAKAVATQSSARPLLSTTPFLTSSSDRSRIWLTGNNYPERPGADDNKERACSINERAHFISTVRSI